jgi:CubicO group peptidase (beta-lactamase class C family)
MVATGLLLLAAIGAGPGPTGGFWPGEQWEAAGSAEAGLDATLLARARDYALTGGGSGVITRGGRLVLSWGDLDRRFDLKSSTKAIGVTALGLAIRDGKIALEDRAKKHHPGLGIPPDSNAETGWLGDITIRHLATQTAGFEKPGGYGRLLFAPGTRWHYSDAGPNWLAECVTLAYRRDVNDLLFERVFSPIGIQPEDLVWRKNAYRPAEIDGIPRREFGSGISANVDAMARIGTLYLRGGRWKEDQILPGSFVDAVRSTVPSVVGLPIEPPSDHDRAPRHYGLLWWNNADGTLPGVPRDAFWSWGLYDSLIVVIPSLDIVVARAGDSWKRAGGEHYAVLEPFLGPIASSVRAASVGAGAPYPPSRSIVGIDWAPAASIVRRARGGDNWPLTWADDDAMYTAYGDGNGFDPKVPQKLSLGLAKVLGTPEDFTGVNLRAPTAERKGDGAAGEKASGMLMVDGVIYMWVRNAGNSRLAWSADHGATWTWSPWRFTSGFGCPTFLNFGRNYAGARDRYVYVASHDSDSAYEPSDRMAMSRVPSDRIADREAYEFFSGLDPGGQPLWTREIADRGAVFSSPVRCYRSGISYDAELKRYLWCQILPGKDPRFSGGVGIYDAPEPWGPWTTVFFTEQWDVGPGETASFPTKWMSDGGKSLVLVFSGDDCFSTRRARLATSAGAGQPGTEP